MKSAALYRALIEAGASEESATRAAEDVIHEAQQSQPATKVDLAKQETRLMIWIAGIIMFILAGVVVASIGLSSQGMVPVTWMIIVLLLTVSFIIFLTT